MRRSLAALGVAVLLGTATPAYAARDSDNKKRCGREYSCNKNGHRGEELWKPSISGITSSSVTAAGNGNEGSMPRATGCAVSETTCSGPIESPGNSGKAEPSPTGSSSATIATTAAVYDQGICSLEPTLTTCATLGAKEDSKPSLTGTPPNFAALKDIRTTQFVGEARGAGRVTLFGSVRFADESRKKKETDDSEKCKGEHSGSCNRHTHNGDNNFVPKLDNSPVTICIGPNSCPGKGEKPG
jgi:hypothetical protein